MVGASAQTRADAEPDLFSSPHPHPEDHEHPDPIRAPEGNVPRKKSSAFPLKMQFKPSDKITYSSKSVRDHIQQATIQGNTITVNHKAGRQTAEKTRIPYSEWLDTHTKGETANPAYNQRKLVEKYTAEHNWHDAPGGPDQADRLVDSVVSAIAGAHKKRQEAESSSSGSPQISVPHQNQPSDKITYSSKSVLDHIQQATIQGNTITVNHKAGRQTAEKTRIPYSEWLDTHTKGETANPAYNQRKLVEKYTAEHNWHDAPGGPDQADRLVDSVVSAIAGAHKKRQEAESSSSGSPQISVPHQDSEGEGSFPLSVPRETKEGAFAAAKQSVPPQPTGQLMAGEVTDILLNQAGNKKELSPDARKEMQAKWIASPIFKVMRVPIDLLHTIDVPGGVKTQTVGPIIVDWHRGRADVPPRSLLVLEGNDRIAAAKAKGEEYIEALVGQKLWGRIEREAQEFPETPNAPKEEKAKPLWKESKRAGARAPCLQASHASRP